MLKQKKVSIVIPVYNVERYLEECLNSVVNQIYQYLEVILVNDGSTDHSLSICEKYKEQYAYITVVSQENGGLSAARNTGMKYATGDYIYFLDSDDSIKESTIEILTEEMTKNNLDIAYFDSDVVVEIEDFDQISNYDRSKAVSSEVFSGMEYFEEYMPQQYIPSACLSFFDFHYLKKNNLTFLEGRLYEDNLFWFKAIIHAERIKYVNEKLYIRRYRKDSIMTKKIELKNAESQVDILENIAKEAARNKNQFGRKAKYAMRNWYHLLTDNALYFIRQAHLTEEDEKKCNVKTLQMYFYIFCLFVSDQNWMISDYNNLLERLNFVKFHQYMVELNTCILQQFQENDFSVFNEKINCERHRKYVDFFRQLPLQENKTVGIYGLGKHTEKFLGYYEAYMGKFSCDLIFIDSNKKTGETMFLGHEVWNVQDIKEKVDVIIVSSYKFELEICQTIFKQFQDKIPIIRLYQIENLPLFP